MMWLINMVIIITTIIIIIRIISDSMTLHIDVL